MLAALQAGIQNSTGSRAPFIGSMRLFRAEAGLRRLQAEEIEDEEAPKRHAHGQPVLRRLLRRVLRPELTRAVNLPVPRAPPRDVIQSVLKD